LIAGQNSVGNADTHHEKFGGFPFAIGAANDAYAITLSVNSPRTEIGAEPFGRNGIAAIARKFANFVEMIPSDFALRRSTRCALLAMVCTAGGRLHQKFVERKQSPRGPVFLARGLWNFFVRRF
jgi:hypothetical protein